MTDRELDAQVAMQVMGWTWFRVERHMLTGRQYFRALRKGNDSFSHFDAANMDEPVWENYGQSPPHYSTSISAAWLVVEEMNRRGYSIDFCGDPNEPYRCWFQSGDDATTCGQGKADTAPLAICEAALEALK